MTITALPTPVPTRQDSANFSDRADAFLAALPAFATEANALAIEVNGYKTSATASAGAASASATAANAIVNVALWSAATNYSVGQAVYSPTSFLTYRRKIAGTTATDPATDTTNWTQVTGTGNVTSNVSGFIGIGIADALEDLHIKSATLPAVLYENTTGAANAKYWRTYASATQFVLDARNDLLNASSNAYIAYRVGLDVASHNWYTYGASRLSVAGGIVIIENGSPLATTSASKGLQLKFDNTLNVGYIQATQAAVGDFDIGIGVGGKQVYLDVDSSRVAINTNDAQAQLDVYSNVTSVENWNLLRLRTNGSGSLTVNHVGVLNNFADGAAVGDIVVRTELNSLLLASNSGRITLGSHSQKRFEITVDGAITTFVATGVTNTFIQRVNNVSISSFSSTGTNTNISNLGSGTINFNTGGSTRVSIDNAGVMLYNSAEVGYCGVPLTSTGAATATRTIRGQGYLATGNITINNSVFQAGDVFTIVNNTASAITVVQGTITTMRLAGTTTTGTRTIAPYGTAVVFFTTATECRVSGAGVS